jgi:hypothetical protein
MMAEFLSLFRPSKKNDKPKPKMGDVAWSESQLYRGAFPKYNPDDLIGRKGFKIYRNMMLDEQVKAVVKFKRDAITSRDFTFTLDDERLSEKEAERRIAVYEDMIDKMAGSFNDGLNYVMSAMYQGFSITEKKYETFDHDKKPYIGIYRLMPKPFETFEFDVDDYGNIKKLMQVMDGKEQKINLSKFIYHIHNPEFDQHYGQSDLREAYRSWYSKDVIIRLYNQFLERFAGGFVVAKPADGTTLTQGTKEFNAIKAAIDNIRQQTSILFPSKMELDMHQPAATDQFEKAIVMHDLQIAKALLVPNLLGISHNREVGSYAQANTQLEAFLWTLDADCKRLKDTLNEQLFLPLNEMNFGDGIGPIIHFKPVSEQKKHETIAIWKDLVASNAVEASDTDESHLRELLEFPEKGTPRPPPMPAGQPGQAAPQPKDDDKGKVNATVIGAPSGQIVSNVEFSKAAKRVPFRVIEKKATELERMHSERIAEKVGGMVNNLIESFTEDTYRLEDFSKVDFAYKDKLKVRRAMDRMIQDGWNLGERFAKDEIATAKGKVFKADFVRMGEEAESFLKAAGWRMYGHLDQRVKEVIQAVLIKGLKLGWSFKRIGLRVYDELTHTGYLTRKDNARFTGRTLEAVEKAIKEIRGEEEVEVEDIEADWAEWEDQRIEDLMLEARYVDTAVRTTLFEAINEARYAMFTDPTLAGFIEALEYSAIMDARTTEICRHMDDRVYSLEDWNTKYAAWRPMNHFNCRSILIGVYAIDRDIRGKDAPEGSRWSPPPTIRPQEGFGFEDMDELTADEMELYRPALVYFPGSTGPRR